MTQCIVCASEVPENSANCATCGQDAGPPNVRTISTVEESAALDARYQEALKAADASGTTDRLRLFEAALETSSAHMASDLYVIRQLLTNSKQLYSNYMMGVDVKMRKAAEPDDDRRRRAVDALLFDGYADQIVFAALCLGNTYVRSYGEYAIRLKQIAIARRATLLEENSFDFVKKHCAGLGPVPKGFQSTWDNRCKLAVAKLQSRIKPHTTEREFPTILVNSSGDRKHDDFIEVHIYGFFDGNAIEAVIGPLGTRKGIENTIAEFICELLVKSGRQWIST